MRMEILSPFSRRHTSQVARRRRLSTTADPASAKGEGGERTEGQKYFFKPIISEAPSGLRPRTSPMMW